MRPSLARSLRADWRPSTPCPGGRSSQGWWTWCRVSWSVAVSPVLLTTVRPPGRLAKILNSYGSLSPAALSPDNPELRISWSPDLSTSLSVSQTNNRNASDTPRFCSVKQITNFNFSFHPFRAANLNWRASSVNNWSLLLECHWAPLLPTLWSCLL